MRRYRAIFVLIASVVVLPPRASFGDRIYLTNGEALRGEVTVLKDGTIEVLHPDGIEGTITFSPDEVKSIKYEEPEPKETRTPPPVRSDADRMEPNPLEDFDMPDMGEDSMMQTLTQMLGSAGQGGVGSMLKSSAEAKGMIQKATKLEAYVVLRNIKTAQMIYFMENGRYATCKNDEEIASVLGMDTSQRRYFDYSTSGDARAFVATAIVSRKGAEQGGLPKGAKIVFSSRTKGFVEAGWNTPEPAPLPAGLPGIDEE